jgi:hypothetical protein
MRLLGASEIRKLYDGLQGFTYKIGYNARDVRLGTEVMFFSRDLAIPPIEPPMTSRRALRRREASATPDLPPVNHKVVAG